MPSPQLPHAADRRLTFTHIPNATQANVQYSSLVQAEFLGNFRPDNHPGGARLAAPLSGAQSGDQSFLALDPGERAVSTLNKRTDALAHGPQAIMKKGPISRKGGNVATAIPTSHTNNIFSSMHMAT